MKQIVVISGKGGTGKSTIVASLARIVPGKMLADCDVDAPNLHLLLDSKRLSQSDYSGASQARLDSQVCIACGRCREVCRFGAISPDYRIVPLSCEGCAACTVVCPVEAIRMESVKTGETYVSKAAEGTFAHARLEIGAEASGKLVTEVRKSLFLHEQGEDYVLIDGSPGIGCVVIASITGADAVVAVAEPTRSGQHDLERVLAVARHFQVKSMVCINKWDLYPEMTEAIEAWCAEQDIPVVARIPYDPAVVAALKERRTPVEAGLDHITRPIAGLWQRVMTLLA